MADESDNGFGVGGNAFDGGAGAAEPQVDKPRADRINRKKLEGLSGSGKLLQIFNRSTKGGPLVECKEIKDLPREVAGVCSNLIYEKIVLKGGFMFFIPDTKKDEDPIPLDAWKFVFEWIKMCGEKGDEASLKDDIILPEPGTESEDGLGPVIDILRAAQKLRVPYDSFQKFVIKQMMGLARKYLIPIERVKKIYYQTGDYATLSNLREVAWTSIFEAWYMYKLDAEEHDEYMEKLGDLRLGIEDLDDDLKEAKGKKDEVLKAARERKRAKDASEENVVEGGGFGGDVGGEWPAQSGSDGLLGGDDCAKQGGGGSFADPDAWEQQAAGATTNDWDIGAQKDDGKDGVNWAEEMNNDYQHKSGFDPAPTAPSIAW